MTSRVMPMCGVCTHIHIDPKTNKPTSPWSCTAFPDSIPIPILYSDVDHRQPVKGDNGIQFEAEDKDGEEYVALIWDQPPTADEETGGATDHA